MMSVESRRMSQPSANSASSSDLSTGEETSQTTCGIGTHFQQMSASSKLDISTYVLRSTECGTIRVQAALKPGLAMTLCCTAKSPSNSRVTASASGRVAPGPESIVLGTTRLPTKPMAYRKAPRNTA